VPADAQADLCDRSRPGHLETNDALLRRRPQIVVEDLLKVLDH
jgi:hypothetical protein